MFFNKATLSNWNYYVGFQHINTENDEDFISVEMNGDFFQAYSDDTDRVAEIFEIIENVDEEPETKENDSSTEH